MANLAEPLGKPSLYTPFILELGLENVAGVD